MEKLKEDFERTYKHSDESKVSISELMLPSHSNFSGKIHGGHILNLMDQIAFACASKHSAHYCVTASVNRVDFLTPIEVGELLTMKAMVNYTGNTSMVVGVRVESENIQTGEVKHCNSSYFTMVAKDSQGKSVHVPGLILDSIEAVRRYARSMKRSIDARSKTDVFKSEEFHVEEFLEKIDGQNAMVMLS